MNRRISPAAHRNPAALTSGYLAYSRRPNQRQRPEKHRRVQTNVPCQSWNVVWNQSDTATFQKVAKTACAALKESEGFQSCNPLNSRRLRRQLANICELTTAKTPENVVFQTPTTQSAFLIKINNMPGMCRLGTKPESPLESAKRSEIVERIETGRQSGNVLWNQRHDRKCDRPECKIACQLRTGMSFRINKSVWRDGRLRRSLYLPVNSRTMRPGAIRSAGFRRKNNECAPAFRIAPTEWGPNEA